MGYLTNYDFSGNRKEVIQAIEDSSRYGKSDDGHYYQIKWYDCRKNMLAVSLLFPEEILIISGEGEEQGDTWQAYFKNGKYIELRPEIVFPEFDESMLK